MAKHISIRMAWHNDGWNGSICKEPKKNTYCCGRFSYPGDTIVRDRDLEWETSVCGKSCSKVDKAPPCSCSINAFGLESIKTFQKPPEWWKDGAKGINIELPPATVCIWPYDAVYGDDVKFEPGSSQKYDNDKRFKNVESYFDQLEENKSLLFYYANYSNPLSTEENNRYVLIGVGKLKEKGKYHYYENVSDEYKKRYAKGLVWQYPLTSNYPEEGVRIPFHLYIDKPEILEKLAIYPDTPKDFKYATRPLSDDDAVSIIEKFIFVVNYLKEIGDKSENWDERLRWLNHLTAELWKARGPYPGLIKVLDYMKFTEVMEYLRKNPEKQSDILDNLKAFFTGEVNTIDGIPLDAKRQTAISRDWKLKDKEEQRILLDILPLFDLSKLQIGNILKESRADNGMTASLNEICDNPYILSEQYSGDDMDDVITFYKIDNGILPPPDMGTPEFFDKNSAQRFRALCVETLKRTTEHSFVSDLVVINAINTKLKNYPESKQAVFTPKYFEVDEDFLSDVLSIKKCESKTYLYLKETWDDERIIESTIRNIAQRPGIEFKTPLSQKFFEEKLFDSNSELAKKNEKDYREAIKKQADVCFGLFNKSLCVISGAAGTGKTTIVHSLLAAIEKVHGQGTTFLLLAPTGKASQRMREATEKHAMTIHSLLASKGWLNDNFTYKRIGGVKAKEYSTIIIDEFQIARKISVIGLSSYRTCVCKKTLFHRYILLLLLLYLH
ncbi:hypothetical protein FACS1894161_3000 [Spirochaetia bacterium]|nr:hypothetical protein FACS1894161_3000 [Spirochaetia bacterium]